MLARIPPPVAPPGRDWAYSNVGYLLALREIGRVTGLDPDALLTSEVIVPLMLDRTRLARGPEALPHLPPGYDFGWVYHRCLIGPADAAARLVHAATENGYVDRADLTARRRLGGAVPGRPWTDHGYGLGLMSGTMGGAGPAMDHSGGGPISTCAIYRFPDSGLTAAAFSRATSEAVPERAVARLARRARRA